MNTEIYYSLDDADYNLEDFGDVLQALLDRDGCIEVGAVYYEGDCRLMTARDVIKASDVIEQIGDALWDEVGEYADGYPDVTEEAKAELEMLLHEWVEKYDSPSKYWKVVGKTREKRVTQDDIERHKTTAQDVALRSQGGEA